MAARVFSAFKRISRARTYCSSRSIEPPTSGLDECNKFNSSEGKKLFDAYKDGLTYLVKESKKLDREMERIKRSIAEDLSRMGYLEEHEVPGLKTMFSKLNLPHQAKNRLGNVLSEWEDVQGLLKRIDAGIAEESAMFEKTKIKLFGVVKTIGIKLAVLSSVLGVASTFLYQTGRLLKPRPADVSL